MADCKHEWWATTLDGVETKRFCVKCFEEAAPVVPEPEKPVYDPYEGYGGYLQMYAAKHGIPVEHLRVHHGRIQFINENGDVIVYHR